MKIPTRLKPENENQKHCRIKWRGAFGDDWGGPTTKHCAMALAIIPIKDLSLKYNRLTIKQNNFTIKTTIKKGVNNGFSK